MKDRVSPLQFKQGSDSDRIEKSSKLSGLVVNVSGTKIGDQACIPEVETMKEQLNLFCTTILK